MENIATTPQNINFSIPVMLYNKGAAMKQIEVLKKACKKFKVAEPEVTFSKPYIKRMVSDDILAEVSEYEVFDLTINVLPSFKLEGGYVLQAIVDNETGNSVAVDIDNFNIPFELLQPSNHCDHCGTSRDRAKSFILQNPDGELMRVGSACVKKFLGINPQKFISMLNFYKNFETTFISDCENSYREARQRSDNGVVIKREEAITALVSIINADNGKIVKAEYIEEEAGGRYNFYMKKVRTNPGLSTCERASDMIMNSRYKNKPLEINYAYDKSFVEFVEKLDINVVYNELDNRYDFETGFDSFKNDMFKFVERDVMRLGDIYPLCGAISYFEKYKITQANKELKGESNFVGTVGTKHKIVATVVDHKSGVGVYGTWHLWTLVDSDNNTFTKFGTLSDKYRTAKGTEYLTNGINKGDVFAFTSEIKAHKEFREIKSTELGRLSKF
jgi:hypothetical protein